MKNLNSFECQGVVKDVTLKDVVVIGNGPSGISLSYFLAGNWPYWNPEAIINHPDELLKNRLKFLDSNKSLIEHDLYSLTQGLEGRTTNPVSLLFDSLHHPGADVGLKLSSMLEYRYHKDKEIDHVVLGKGKPGGAWHAMDKNLRTLSLAEWMSLPNMNFNDWERNFTARCSNVDMAEEACEPVNLHKINFERRISEEVKTRALVASVADYYASYVKLMNLEKFFRSETIVVKIREVKKNDTIFNNSKFENARWIVQGYDRNTKKPFIIVCRKIVLANGTSDLANRLGVRGEQKSLSWLKYELPSLEHAINKSTKVDEKMNFKPIVIVGAGLSAADAVIACRNSGIKVIHVFRSLTGGFMNLPQAYFPEYNLIYEMMRNSQTQDYELYKALPECALKEIKSSNGKHLVTIQNLRNEECQTYEVSYCAILIGSRPDLSLLNDLSVNSKIPKSMATSPSENSTDNFIMRTLKRLKIFCEKCRHLNLCFGFLQKHPALINSLIEESQVNDGASDKKEKCDTGLGFGERPERPIDVKNNPIAVNKFSNELLQIPGIFAMGPLVGDNFVRFIAGGALSITSSFHSETK